MEEPGVWEEQCLWRSECEINHGLSAAQGATPSPPTMLKGQLNLIAWGFFYPKWLLLQPDSVMGPVHPVQQGSGEKDRGSLKISSLTAPRLIPSHILLFNRHAQKCSRVSSDSLRILCLPSTSLPVLLRLEPQETLKKVRSLQPFLFHSQKLAVKPITAAERYK